MKSSKLILAVVSFLSIFMLMGSQGYGESHVLKKKSSKKEGFLVNHNRFGAPVRDAEGRPINYSREELQVQEQAWRLRQPLILNIDGRGYSMPKSAGSPDSGEWASWSYGTFGRNIGLGGMLTDIVNGNREIYVAGWQDNGTYWYTLQYNSLTGQFEQTFVSTNLGEMFQDLPVGIKLVDVTGDSSKEIVVALRSGAVHIYDQATKKYVKKIEYDFGYMEECVHFEISDIDGDGKKEYIFSTGGKVIILSNSGSLIWDDSIRAKSIAVGQMDTDATPEIAIEVNTLATQDRLGYVIDGKTKNIQWTKVGGFGDALEAIDIDNDGIDELIANVSNHSHLVAYDVEFQLLKWTIEDVGFVKDVYVGDVNSDSAREIIVCSSGLESIQAYDLATLEKEWSVNSVVVNSPDAMCVFDVNGDGYSEIMCENDDLYSTGKFLSVVDGQSHEIIWQNVDLSSPFCGPEVGDLNGDGIKELVIASRETNAGYDGARILVFNTNGTLRAMSEPIRAIRYQTELFAEIFDLKLFDIDQDGKEEIIVAGGIHSSGEIFVYDFNSDNTFSLNWTNSTKPQGALFESVTVSDVDSDGQFEIVGVVDSVSRDNPGRYVHVYDYNTGNEEWHSPSLCEVLEKISAVEAFDIDNDGGVEIIAMVHNGDVYVFNGKTKELKTTLVGPYTAMSIINTNFATPSLALGNSNGDIKIVNGVSGGVYRTVFERNFVDSPIHGISELSTYDQLIFGTGGTLKIGLYDGTIKWTSANYGYYYGKNAVLHPNGNVIYSAGVYSVNAFEYTPLPSVPSLRVVSPNGSEAWDVGTTQNISWTSSWSVGDVKIEYSTDNGGTWSTITDAADNVGSYSWVIPNAVSGQCLVKVSEAADGSPADTSNAVFSITSSSPTSSISVSSPNGGELLSVGTSYPISWFTAGSVGNVKIEYSTNNGSTWSTVTNSTINNGNYAWTVPNTPSDKCLVRISDAAGGSPSDTGDAAFEITTAPPAPAVTVNSPNGGEYLMVGGTYPISWYATGGITNVKIEYSADNGGSWSTITNSVPNNGIYSWTIPNAASGRCLVRVSDAAGGSPSDVSNGTFSITTNPTPPTLTVSSPNGGEVMTVGTTYPITWYTTGTVGGVKIEYSTNNGGSWSTIVNSTLNTGNYSWTVPNTVSDSCVVRISDVANGTPSDTGNTVFSITPNPIPPSINIASPNGGETWRVGSIQTISWYSTGSINNVKIQYSVNNGGSWSTIVSSTPNDGKHSIIVPNTISGKCLIKVSDTAGKASDKSSGIFSITTGEIPEITLDRNELTFYSIIDGGATGAQTFTISNSGDGVLVWNLSVDTPVVICTPMSGSGYQVVSVSVNPAGLIPGIYRGSIKVIALDAENQSKIINVTLTVKHKSECEPPFGEFSTPVEGVTVSGSIPVTGWVLDDIGVESVKIYNGDSYVGDAVFVEGARPDVEAAYQGYPNNNKAGWGYMLLTNFLPGGGNGTYTLNAVATDKEGNEVTLGSKTIVVDNANAVKPFGAIDTPAQGGLASGKAYINWGWVLTPQPNSIPLDGSTIDVWVNGVAVGKPTYNIYREDIATLFPNFVNSNGAVGYFYLDTTGYDNGAHTIQWTAKDSGGNVEGIGSRYFMIGQGNNRQADDSNLEARRKSSTNRAISSVIDTTTLPVDDKTPVDVIKGYYRDSEASSVFPQENGTIRVEIEELERLEIKLAPGTYSAETLPVGSQLDTRTGTFYWQPGPGFLGDYLLEFVQQREDGVQVLRKLLIIIKPKY